MTREQTIQLDIPLLLNEVECGRGECLERLERLLADRRGIQRVHVRCDTSPAQLCLHFDPNLISLAVVVRLARAAGSRIGRRYRHEAIPFAGMDSADAADVLATALEALPGMLHAQVNYAAGLAFVAYDTERLRRSSVESAVRRMGYDVLAPPRPWAAAASEEARLGRQGDRFTALPQWMQVRWRLILVGLAGLFFLGGWLGQRFLGLPGDMARYLFVLAYLAGGYALATHAIPGLFRGRFDTDVLMLAAAAGAAVLGQWAEGAFLLFLFGLGHAGEHYALDRARRAVNALGALMPRVAHVMRDDALEEVPVEQVRVGDVVLVRPGDRLPVDGRVKRGQGAMDQSAITGESVPVHKGPGDEVFAGAVNQENAIEVTVTRLARDNTLQRVLQLVAEAQEQRSPTQHLARRFAARFVPAVLVLVVLVALVPPVVGWMSWQDSLYRAILLLIAASPCALAIGTPAAVLAGIAQAARHGVLIKGGVHLENLGRLQAMAFDKTGTLTEGRFRLTDVICLDGLAQDDLLQLAAAVEQQSNHPLAQAVVQAARDRNLTLPRAAGLESVSGLGVQCEVDDQTVCIGSLRYFRQVDGRALNEAVIQSVGRLESEGKTTMAVSRNGRFVGVLALADGPRPGVRQTLQALREVGVPTLVMLTGDNEGVARRIGQAVGVTDVRAGLLPEHKLAAIKELQETHGDIAMIGDGINDAPALATATVGIAMGGAGTAVALETADVALMADDLSRLPFAVGLSRASRAVIRQNLVISLAVIALLIPASLFGLVALSGAVVLHEGSTVLVTLNALRLLGYRQGA
jgi:Zn2+/Cd2+-exporting ATPase